jgi:hypothetical protein
MSSQESVWQSELIDIVNKFYCATQKCNKLAHSKAQGRIKRFMPKFGMIFLCDILREHAHQTNLIFIWIIKFPELFVTAISMHV